MRFKYFRNFIRIDFFFFFAAIIPDRYIILVYKYVYRII